mgnify:FL=1
MANYDNANGFRPAIASMRRIKGTVGATAVHAGDVLGMAAGVLALYSTTTHPQGPCCVAAEDGAAAASIDVYPLEPGGVFIAQFDGTYSATSHDGERFDISGGTGAQQIGTAQTTGLIRVIGHAPETGSLDTGANARVLCEFMFGATAGLNLTSFRSSSVPAAAADRITNTASATAFATTKTVDVSELRVGDRLRIRAAVKAVATNSTNTLTCNLKLGSVSLCASPATDVTDGDVVTFDAEIEVKATGGSGSIQGSVLLACKFNTTLTTGPYLVGPSQSIDLSADTTVSVEATWSAASTSNQADLVDLSLRRIPAGL